MGVERCEFDWFLSTERRLRVERSELYWFLEKQSPEFQSWIRVDQQTLYICEPLPKFVFN